MVKDSPVSTGQPTTAWDEMEWVDDPKISPLQAKGGRVNVLAMITAFSCAKNTTSGFRITKYAHTLKHLHSTVHSSYTACHVLNLSPQSSEVNVVSKGNVFEMKESNKWHMSQIGSRFTQSCLKIGNLGFFILCWVCFDFSQSPGLWTSFLVSKELIVATRKTKTIKRT